jgi:predicted CoA-binding protein
LPARNARAQDLREILSEVPEPIDMGEIFRASSVRIGPIVQEALTLKPSRA